MDVLHDIRYGLSDTNILVLVLWNWDRVRGYSVVEVDSCKTALRWVVVGNSGECGYS